MVGSKDLQPSNARFFPNVFFHNQFRAKPEWPSQTTNLSDKVAIITGGNAGLGLEAASQLLSFKLSHLILAVRSTKKGEAAAKQLLSQYPKAKIEIWPLDMSSMDSIRAFARRVDTDLSRLDMVVLNAGVRKLSFDTVRSTGHEETIQINYLSTVLLTILLLPSLKSKSPPGTAGRLTIVNAALALAAKFPNRNEVPLLPSFDDPKYFDPIDRYNSSKVLAHMFLWKLVDYVSANDVIVNLPDPGFVKGTDLTRDARGGQKVAAALFGAITGRTKKDGASTYLDALVNKGSESHGCFIMSWQIHPFAGFLYTPEGKEITERLWEETLSEFDFAGVRGILDSMKRT
ncbi:hypothetical protein HO173_007813 [Letharia columbiana]|uniref:Short-chain dehydrogenase/reductase family protein n=1 Tax=Letharia columbiana TaxID=112416 RepID=A0A8H6L3D5_9LECA|nr:uncharacterized protein HO173_007813 [Letharia columbiana]KAF6233983.1 hypothetical protein HO173_007813 [Letharia columbiana]